MSIRSLALGTRRGHFVAFATALFVLLPVSLAGAACPLTPTKQAFAPWGDTAEYAQVPGGSFEQGGAGWTFISANITAGNDPFNVVSGRNSAALGSGWGSLAATAISPEFCVDKSHPYFRFMLKPQGAVGALATFIIYRNTAGNLVRQILGSKIATNILPGNWRPSELNPLSVNIPLLEAGGTATVQLGFISPLSFNGPAYFIDNVLVDPYRRG
ncbi:MAG: hypothetical protein J7513_04135 [Solirubrobacteraceae bacterium]|nr:hypothetical protein [Solirubrobacteraceae bacterium]